MRITCPHCGEREVGEFAYYGDATKHRPDGSSELEAFIEYVYPRDNPAGPHRELWYHVGGCRGWLVVNRDTRTHEIFGVETAHDRRAEGARNAVAANP
ncbi:MAG: sarcosine oxidase subunit delta [Hyphomicrobiales bacterium]|nr:sarcosine oxidase subunit delta [Hyphomicrobiales bacterium]